MRETPRLETPRLLLEPLASDHAEALHLVLDDPALHTFTGGVPLGPEALRVRIALLMRGPELPDGAEKHETWWNWVLRRRVDDAVLGYVQATVGAKGDAAEVAWVVGTPHQGQGLAREAARCMVGWLRAYGGATEVVANIHPEHRASEGVARACGLTATGELDPSGEQIWRWMAPGSTKA